MFASGQWRSQVPAFGGAVWERSEKIRGSGGLPPGKFLGATPIRRSENEGNALFSHILHHKHDYIEHKRQDVLLNFHQEIILIIASYSKEAKEEFLFSYKRWEAVQHIKCKIRNESSQLYCKRIWCWSFDLDIQGIVSLSYFIIV